MVRRELTITDVAITSELWTRLARASSSPSRHPTPNLIDAVVPCDITGPTWSDTTRRGHPAPYRIQCREAAIDRAIHRFGIFAAIVACGVLLTVTSINRGVGLVLGVTLYAIGLVAMLVCSALYNAAPPSPRKALLRRLDHAAIFLQIAGTYSPFMADATDDRAIAALYAGVWLTAAAGFIVKLLFPGRFERLSVILYLALGWSVVIVIEPMSERLPSLALTLIAAGGVLYSIGVGIHLWRRLPYQNAIWHAVVVAAAATHCAAVFDYVMA